MKPSLTLALVLLTACGEIPSPGGGGDDGGGGDVDGGTHPTPDGMIVDPTDAAPPVGTVTAIYLEGTVPRAGVDVIFQNHDGTIAGQGKTNALGEASHTLAAGGMVTVFIPGTPGNTRPRLWTVAGVKPGDRIPFGTRGDSPPTTTSSVKINIPTVPAGTAMTRFSIGCSYLEFTPAPPSNSAELQIYPECLSPAGKYSVAVVATDSAGKPIAFTTLKNMTPIPGAASTVTMPSWRTDLFKFDLRVKDAPLGVTSISLQARMMVAGVEFYEPSFDTPFPAGSDQTFTFFFPRDFMDGLAYQAVGMISLDTLSQGFVGVLAREIGQPASATVDFKAMDVPVLRDPIVSNGPTEARPRVSWAVVGSLATADLMIYVLNYRTPMGQQQDWLIYASPGTMSPFTVPELPASLATYAPVTSSASASVFALGADFVAGYDDFRDRIGAKLFEDDFNGPMYTVWMSLAGMPD